MKKLVVLGAFLAAPAAFAQTGSSARQTDAPDPNEMVCRMIAETGSRLTRSRVCMTRAQWAQQRRETRDNVERGQQRQTNPQG